MYIKHILTETKQKISRALGHPEPYLCSEFRVKASGLMFAHLVAEAIAVATTSACMNSKGQNWPTESLV